MIVRILGEGQWILGEEHLDELNAYDENLANAVAASDESGFKDSLTTLLDRVKGLGVPISDDDLTPSDLILPGSQSTLGEVAALLHDEGLIPG